MNDIETLNKLVEQWADTDPQNINKMDEIQKQIVEVRNKIADYPVELIKISKTIDTVKKQEEYMDSYTKVEEYLKICERFNIKYNKHINLINPNINQIIKTIWEIKEKEYTENPKYDTKEIKQMIKQLTN